MSTANDTGFFGHPRGLSTLFFTEMWERFSYYGMRALLILFITAPVATGGLGFDTATAGAIYGLYTSMVYLTTLPGGWIADRLIGAQNAVLYGGVLIAAGHFSMAVPSLPTFYLGLLLIVIGTGLLKGNVSVIVGRLYSRRGRAARRRLLDLLHGHQPGRVHRAAGVRLPRAARELAPRLRRGRRRHDAGAGPVRARPQAPRRCGPPSRPTAGSPEAAARQQQAGHAGGSASPSPCSSSAPRRSRPGCCRSRRRSSPTPPATCS